MFHEFTCENCGKYLRAYRGKDKAAPKFCSRKCRDEYKSKLECPWATKEWLYQKYHVEKLSMVDIGSVVNRDTKTVLHWMRKYDIPTRARGSNEKVYFKKGQKSAFAGRKHTQETKEQSRETCKKVGKVPYLRNGVHWLHTVSGEENPNWKGGIIPERQTFYRSDEWKKAIKQVWKRDNAICQRCGLDHRTVDRSKVSFHIHHIVSFAVRELRCELSNLVLLCPDCHYWVHGNENANGDFIKEPLP